MSKTTRLKAVSVEIFSHKWMCTLKFALEFLKPKDHIELLTFRPVVGVEWSIFLQPKMCWPCHEEWIHKRQFLPCIFIREPLFRLDLSSPFLLSMPDILIKFTVGLLCLLYVQCLIRFFFFFCPHCFLKQGQDLPESGDGFVKPQYGHCLPLNNCGWFLCYQN